MKIAIVGNCQGGAMERIVASGDANIVTYNLPANYLAREEHRPQFDAAYADCDVILIQNVSDTFGTDFVKPDYVRLSGKPVLVWPVIYFNGYFPDIGYLRDGTDVVEGPLGGYHSHYIRDRYLRGWEMADVISSYAGEDYAEMYQGSFTRSIDEISQREGRCDLFASNQIREKASDERLFLTPNHPINRMIVQLIEQAETMLGIKLDLPAPGCDILDEIIFPINSHLLQAEGAKFDGSQCFAIKAASGGVEEISSGEMVSRFFHLYDTLPIEIVRHGIAC